MLENERERVKKIDKLIFDMLKTKMGIRKDNVDIISDNGVEEVINKINEKMEIIFLMFQGDFSINERTIEEKIEVAETNLGCFDKIANNIILKRLDNVIEEIEKLDSRNGLLISVCFDRKLFIKRVLTKNVSLIFVKEHIQNEREL